MGILHLYTYTNLLLDHIEYAVPAWASVSEKDRTKIDEVQVQCLKKVMGIKSNSSSAAVEVIANVMPMRIRIRQLCCREYARIMTKNNDHMLRTLLSKSVRNGLDFCPLKYIHVMSKQLEKQLSDCTVEIEPVLKNVNYLASIDILTVSDFQCCLTEVLMLKAGPRKNDKEIAKK